MRELGVYRPPGLDYGTVEGVFWKWLLDIAGGTVAIDAMGTQTAIAERIVARGGEYILALKENQPTLLEDARLYFESDYLPQPTQRLAQDGMYAATIDKGHGRIDKRECWIIMDDIHAFRRAEVWPNLHGIAVVRSTRTMTNGGSTTAYHYYIFSHPAMTAEQFLSLRRQHWAIENGLHWVLDTVFREDSTHARVEHIAIVLNLIRKLVLQLLKHDKTLTGSMTGKRGICAWRFDLAMKLIMCDAVS